MTKLVDGFDRKLSYLRLSITDLCNFHCQYCLPEGCLKSRKQWLSLSEIRRAVTAFAELGVAKIRITGGEPSVRKDFMEIIKLVASTPGINEVAYTTNGYHLYSQAEALHAAGLTTLNVSVDSLMAQNFSYITGRNCLDKVLLGIKKAQSLSFNSIKINVVLLKGVNDHEAFDFIDWVKNESISIRFIELMQTKDNLDYFNKHHLSPLFIKKELLSKDWVLNSRSSSAGPAAVLSHKDYAGKVGFIMPYNKSFCSTCNRLRLSSRGGLYLCLFTDISFSLRHLLQDDTQKEELKQKIIALLVLKKESHNLNQLETGLTNNLAMIGG